MTFGTGALLAELEVMLDSSTDLHLDLLVHFLSQFVLVANHDEESNSEQTCQDKNEEGNADNKLVCGRSVVLNASFTFL